MYVTQQEFESFKSEVTSAIERLHSDWKSSYATFQEYMARSEAYLEQRFDALEQRFDALEQRFDALEQRFDALERRFDALERRVESLEKRFDRFDVRLAQVSEDISFMRSSFGARFDVMTAQLRVVDQGQWRFEERCANLEKRVDLLESKPS